ANGTGERDGVGAVAVDLPDTTRALEDDPGGGNPADPGDPVLQLVGHGVDGHAPFGRQRGLGDREILDLFDLLCRDVVYREVQARLRERGLDDGDRAEPGIERVVVAAT